MSGVIAKFRVQPPIENYGGNVNVKLTAVMPSSDDEEVTRDENERFWEATPTGELKMSITNVAAAEQFQIGDDWYLELRRVPKPKAADPVGA